METMLLAQYLTYLESLGEKEVSLKAVLAGATALAVGTALFVDPGCLVGIQEGIAQYLRQYGHKSVAEIVGSLVLP